LEQDEIELIALGDGALGLAIGYVPIATLF
jgi:hypothetical protein